MRRAPLGIALVGLVPLTVLGGCATTDATGSGASTESARQRTVTVLAAASLTDAFEGVAGVAEQEHPGLTVEMSFAASSTLVQQVNAGAPADVVALAGPGPLESIQQELVVTGPTDFATNELQIAVPPGNPAGIRSAQDLTDGDPTIVVCAEAVPCGSATTTLFDRLDLDPPIASFEPDVRATLAKVRLGEADAGIVYRTDVTAAGADVEGIDLEETVTNRYPVVTVSDAPQAQDFLDSLLGRAGQDVLAQAGFGAP